MRKETKKTLAIAIPLLAMLAVFAANYPELKRYMIIRRM